MPSTKNLRNLKCVSRCASELSLRKRASAVDDRRRTPKIFLTNISEFRKWKCPWGIIEQANDNEVIMSLAKYPQAEKCVSRVHRSCFE